MQDRDNVPGPIQSANTLLMVLWGLARIFSQCLTAFSTKPGTAGEKHFGGFINGLSIFALFFGLTVIAQELPPRDRAPLPIYAFWAVTVAANVYQRLKGAALRRTGYSVHSQFVGRPLVNWLPSRREADTKWRWDVVIICLVGCGWGVLFNCAPVLIYCVFAAGLSVIPAMFMTLRDEARVRAAEDARWDAEWMAHQLEQRRQNRWN